jgi:hypothetical protein
MLTAFLIANLVMNFWLLTVLHRHGVRKPLPWFFAYATWGFLSTCVALATSAVGIRFYASAYWWLEGVEVALIVAAFRESFLRIFEGFTSKLSFRWSLWAVIAGVVIYSAWKAVQAPPIQSSRLATFILDSELAFRWGIAAVGVLSAVHMYFLDEPLTGREAAVVIGLGFASATFLEWVVTSSAFGNRFTFFTQYVPTVGYFMAVFWWIWAFSRPVQEVTFKDLGMEPEEVHKEIGRYREFIGRLTRLKW